MKRWTQKDIDKITNKPIKKTKQPSVEPIIDSIKNSIIKSYQIDNKYILIFDGARILTLNEILSILQYRKYTLFSYKKIWHKKINEAILLLGKTTKINKSNIILFRQGKKKIDNDSLPASFKFLIDGLKGSIIPEDDPESVIAIKTIQKTSSAQMIIGLIIEPTEENDNSTSENYGKYFNL